MTITLGNFSLSQYQVQAHLTREYAVKFKAGYESITALKYTQDRLTVGTVQARRVYLAHEDRVTHKGARVIVLDTVTGKLVSDDVYWLLLPAPERLNAFLVRNTPARVAADKEAFMLCYRPGAEAWTGGASKRLGHRDSYRRECER